MFRKKSSNLVITLLRFWALKIDFHIANPHAPFRSQRVNSTLHQTSDGEDKNKKAGVIAHSSSGPKETQGNSGEIKGKREFPNVRWRCRKVGGENGLLWRVCLWLLESALNPNYRDFIDRLYFWSLRGMSRPIGKGKFGCNRCLLDRHIVWGWFLIVIFSFFSCDLKIKHISSKC